MADSNLRPGVFSTFTVLSAPTSGTSSRAAAICAIGTGGSAGQVYRFSDPALVSATFTAGPILEGARLLLQSGVSQVVCVPLGSATPAKEDYRRAFATATALPDIGAVVCDSSDAAVLPLLVDAIRSASASQCECIALAPAAALESAPTLAHALNSERFCLCWPPVHYNGKDSAFYSACALAAAALRSAPGSNLSAALCPGVSLSANLPEATVQSLLAAGVSVFESTAGGVECIRAVTTRTLSGSAPDLSFRDLSTILVIDEILRRVRFTLTSILRGARGNPATLQTIAAQAAVILSAAAEEGLISAFDPPRTSLDPTDRSICIAELSFEPATALCQIRVAARVNLL